MNADVLLLLELTKCHAGFAIFFDTKQSCFLLSDMAVTHSVIFCERAIYTTRNLSSQTVITAGVLGLVHQ